MYVMQLDNNDAVVDNDDIDDFLGRSLGHLGILSFFFGGRLAGPTRARQEDVGKHFCRHLHV